MASRSLDPLLLKKVRQRLRIVQWIALVDLTLLIVLIISAVTGQKDLVHIIGPLHGINFLLLLVMVATPAIDGLWGWWFVALVLFTAGPPGALFGEWIIRRLLAQQEAIHHHNAFSVANATVEKESGSIVDARENI